MLLSDGSAVHLRQIRPEDAPAIVEFHSRMSDRTRYLRYFSPYPRIPERDLAALRQRRPPRPGGVRDRSPAPRIMAVGRYERLGPDSPDAEVAFVVEDAHQGRGIGSVLLEHLAEAARENGITRFVAEVLPENGGMLRVFSDFGYQVQRRYADGVVHLSFPIAPTEKSREVQESREQRTEARSIARLLAPRGGRGLRRQRERSGHRRGDARPPARRRLHRGGRAGAPQRRPGGGAARVPVGGGRRVSRSTWR